MQRTLVTYRYRFTGDSADFRAGLQRAADVIATAPGLIWKIWGIDSAHGIGTSAYLFESPESAMNFTTCPMMTAFGQRPDVKDIAFESAPVDRELSLRTGASFL